ncbi:hypothetical protein BKA67DRAFT_665470 [Truncatella angustata]|uniref:Uncharacterized protein n=1 Tax=Truncatella angustata TaxID=152316 RepID=A0A9P8UBA2_9PEZI|nr:uncharacterized protein BKA67DRAFT_665470 [Truncatella angustata]KAH6638514.1 hypothetical protein BKA67DRAFT_665470 [Truncatella angustata]
MPYLEKTFPWKLVSEMLNSSLLSYRDFGRIEDTQFPRPDKELPRPLPEDFAMKGLLWMERYYPVDWFTNENIDDDEKYFEVASMTEERKERILWLGCRLASRQRGLVYNTESHRFTILPAFERDISRASRLIAVDRYVYKVNNASSASASSASSLRY